MTKTDSRDKHEEAAIAAWKTLYDVYLARAAEAREERDPVAVEEFMKTALMADLRAQQIANGYHGK